MTKSMIEIAYAISKKFIQEQIASTPNQKSNWFPLVENEAGCFSRLGHPFITGCYRTSKSIPTVSYWRKKGERETSLEYRPAWKNLDGSISVYNHQQRGFIKAKDEALANLVIVPIRVLYIHSDDLSMLGRPCLVYKSSKTRKLGVKWSDLLQPLTTSPAERSVLKDSKGKK